MQLFEFKINRELQSNLNLNNDEEWLLTLYSMIITVVGVMLFPNNAEWREDLDAVKFVNKFEPIPAPGFLDSSHVYNLLTPTFFDSIQRASYKEVANRIRKAMGCGKAAGKILWAIKRIDDSPDYKGSVSKATYLLEEIYKIHENEDEYMPIKRTRMLKAWRDYKPVAHLWSAAWHYEMSMAIFHKFYDFLGCSEYFRHFGITNTAGHQKEDRTILSPDETWVLPDWFPISRSEVELPPLTDEERNILDDYQAPI
jgi:hypothetical protein